MSAIAAGSLASRRGRRGRGVLSGLRLGYGRFEILEGQLALVVAQLLGALAMHGLVQFGSEMLQPAIDFPERIAFAQHGNNSGALAFRDGRKIDKRGS